MNKLSYWVLTLNWKTYILFIGHFADFEDIARETVLGLWLHGFDL